MSKLIAERGGIAGHDANAYEQRQKGYSPEDIRDAAWELAGRSASGLVLDIGSGEGGWIKRLKSNPNIRQIIGTDIVDAGAGGLEGVDFFVVDVSREPLPCAAGAADWVFALEVIEHLTNPRHFVLEAYRSLAEGGRLFLSTPCNESLTARLSFLFRGYFPAFCEHDYLVSGHITPIIETDLRRMASESGFKQTEFYYPLPGRIPKSDVYWQKIVPRLRGKLWSDTLFAMLVK